MNGLPDAYHEGTWDGPDPVRCSACGKLVHVGEPYHFGRVDGPGIRMGRWHPSCGMPDFYAALRGG